MPGQFPRNIAKATAGEFLVKLILRRPIERIDVLGGLIHECHRAA
jgi:hypothetical protein